MERRGFVAGQLWIGVLAVAVVCLGGCGGSTHPKTVPLTGKVTLDGQPPGEGGKIFFSPTQPAPGYKKRPASATFNGEGDYRVMSWEPDDGLVPGHYTIKIVTGTGDQKSKIPDRYLENSTSGLELDVPVQSDTLEYNVEIRTE